MIIFEDFIVLLLSIILLLTKRMNEYKYIKLKHIVIIYIITIIIMKVLEILSLNSTLINIIYYYI